MAARYVSSQLIKNISKSGRTLAVEYVDKTTSWTRPSDFPASSVRQDFTDVVQENIDSFSSATTKVAMKYVCSMNPFPTTFYLNFRLRLTLVYFTDLAWTNRESEHQSEMDKRMHYTAFALDKDGNVIETKHLVRHK